MRTPVKFDGRGRRTGRNLWPLVAVAFHSAIAVRYCLAAERDEKNGFPLTAAIEWRKAAELLTPLTSASDRCWREWERIMHLPRHLAGPIGGCDTVPYNTSPILEFQPSAVTAVSHGAAA